MKKPIIYEIELYSFPGGKFNDDYVKAWSFIKDLYWDVFKDDENWHFFYEGEFTVIRFSYKFLKDIKAYLNQRNVGTSIAKKWIDSSKIVEKYKEEYAKLFHVFSMFAIFVPTTEELHQVFDRIAHPFCNHNHYRMAINNGIGGENDGGFTNYWMEPDFISQYLVRRAMYSGKCYHGEEIRKKYDISITKKQ
jgi:hypothetical protein